MDLNLIAIKTWDIDLFLLKYEIVRLLGSIFIIKLLSIN